MTTKTRQVYDILVQVAEDEKPCPTNEQIARMIDSTKSTVMICVRKLTQAGMIKSRNPNNRTRVITILATGKKTLPTKAVRGGAFSIQPKKIQDSDPEAIARAKMLLRRRFSNVYNAEVLHPGKKEYKGKFVVGSKLVDAKGLLTMAAEKAA